MAKQAPKGGRDNMVEAPNMQSSEGIQEQEARTRHEEAIHTLLAENLPEARLTIRTALLQRGQIELPHPLPDPTDEETITTLRKRELKWILNEEQRIKMQEEKRKALERIPGITAEALAEWDKLVVPISTLIKFELPTEDELSNWLAMPKTFSTLQKIKYPLLCKWSLEEIVEAMAPYIGDLVAKYHTERTDREDCKRLGVHGVLQALRRDAGKACFASHAYLSIRTSIRRESARSDVVRDSEKRPSKTEVKKAITHWLSGTFLQSELDRLASDEQNPFVRRITKRKIQIESFENYNDILYTLKLMQRVMMVRPDLTEEIKQATELHAKVKSLKRRVVRMVCNSCNFVRSSRAALSPYRSGSATQEVIFSPASERAVECTCGDKVPVTIKVSFPRDEEVMKFTNTIAKRIFGGDEENYKDFTDLYESLLYARLVKKAVSDKLNFTAEIKECKALRDGLPGAAEASVDKFRQFGFLNETPLIGKTDLRRIFVQKLGKCGHKEMLVRESYWLDRLSVNQRLDLFDFLNQVFNPLKTEKARHILPSLNSDRYRTVADLVMAVACSPNFHSKIQTLSVPLDEGHAKEETISNERRMQRGKSGAETMSSPFLDPRSRFESTSEREAAREVVELVRHRLTLTPEQEVVMIESWGLDGLEAKNGSVIANSWGTLLLEHAIRRLVKQAVNAGVLLVEEIGAHFTKEKVQQAIFEMRKQAKLVEKKGMALKTDALTIRIGAATKLLTEIDAAVSNACPADKISRQRVTQYEEALGKKYREALFEMYFVDRRDSKRALEQARAAALAEQAKGFREEIGPKLQMVEAEIAKIDVQLSQKDVAARREEALTLQKQSLQTRKRSLVLRNVPEALTDDEDSVLCLLYGLNDVRKATFDQVAAELECIRPEVAPLAMPARREILKEIVNSFKIKLLQVNH